jgi:dihydrolipoamide dehydrogenase
MEERSHDMIVIGGGPGGYVAALRAAEFGLNVACVDENDILGGTCLRVGCIPSKALLESSEKYREAATTLVRHGIHIGALELDLAAMMQRKENIVRGLAQGIDGLFARGKVARYLGHARFEGPGRLVVEGGPTRSLLRARDYILATGSIPASIKAAKLDGDRVGTSTEAIAWKEVPKTLVVIGAGYIGLELGSVWRRLGSKVIVVEGLNRILPGTDADLADRARRIFMKQGLEFRLGASVQHASAQGDRCIVQCDAMETIECDRVLVAVGRTPNTTNLGLETLGIQLDERLRIPVNGHFQTAAQGVYAIGDCIGGAMLAHKASDEALACIEMIQTGYGRVNYATIPAVIYTHPELAAVGRTEQQLHEDGVEYVKGTFPFRANGRALTLDDSDGLVKVLADKKTDRILGVHILGPRAGDLIATASVAMELGASSEDLAAICQAHPTLAEALREAAHNVLGPALHGGR